MADVRLQDVRKSFGKTEVIHGIRCAIKDGEFVVILGPSGCGKSTVLRLIAGLEVITAGEISIDGRVVNQLEPSQRDVAMVFQNYALYPHMSVYKNMAYGLRIRRMARDEIDRRVRNAARILELTDLLDRKPNQLSGGQRQRVAMGRCIVRKPKVFLFDEPLSNLDAKLRVQMRLEIRNIHESLRITSIYVTHDQVEAMTLADRLIVMEDGYAVQIGSPLEIYERPANRFVAGFIGSPAMNFFAASLSPDGAFVSLSKEVNLPLPNAGMPEHGGREIIVGIRPEHLRTADVEASLLRMHVDHVELLGADTLAHGHLGDQETFYTVRLTDIRQLQKNTILPLSVSPEKLHLFDRQEGSRISPW